MPVRIIRIVTPEGDLITITVPLVETPAAAEVEIRHGGWVLKENVTGVWEPKELPYTVEIE